MFAFQSSKGTRSFRGYGADTASAATTETKRGLTQQQTTDLINKGGDIVTAAVDAYKDIAIAKITGRAPAAAPALTGTQAGAGMRTAAGRGAGSKGLSTGAIVGIGVGAVAVLGLVGFLVFKKK